MITAFVASSNKIDAITRATCPFSGLSGRPHCARVCPATASFDLCEFEERSPLCPGSTGRPAVPADAPLLQG